MNLDKEVKLDLGSFITKHKNRIFNLLIILVALYFSMHIYRKQIDETTRLTTDKDEETEKNAVLGSIKEIERRFGDYKRCINNKDIATIINTLTNLAQAAGVKVISLRPLTEQTNPLYIKYPFDLKIEAKDYHILGKFISRLESHPNIYNVESLKIRPLPRTPENPEAGRLSAELALSTFLVVK
jgi:Tfp pilus assembly protein PilO